MKKKLWIYPFLVMGIAIILNSSCKKSDDSSNNPSTPPAATTVKDVDGNVYNVVTIGTQVWLKQNLKVKHYRNGDSIPNVADQTQWSGLVTGACCDFNNIPANSITYGRLYNWYTVNDPRKIAPLGWHISTDAEWTTLKTFLGGESIAGGKLKELGITHWKTPNTGATNSSGFTALPTGYRADNGMFDNSSSTSTALWWTSTSVTNNAWYYTVNYDAAFIGRDNGSKTYGYSVRCVKD